MTFAHPLYYRIHCSVFHDIRYSLTIRKYHCKICGVAVLGKENIMKHAAELHNGQGAYQCQFCKKVNNIHPDRQFNLKKKTVLFKTELFGNAPHLRMFS
jgi:hypothetical protein